MNYYKSKILRNEPIEEDIYIMEIENKGISRNVKAGQFASLYVPSAAHLLPRPISVHDATESGVVFMYRAVGEGTKLISRMRAGTEIELTGAAGNGFKLEKGKIAVIGGGIGIFPLFLLMKRLEGKPDCYLGFRSKSGISKKYEAYCETLNISTEDGSEGFRGNAVEMLRQKGIKYDTVYACGPTPMLKAVMEYCEEEGIKCQISAEERMACGVGACIGCAFPVKDGYGYVYKRVCADGPVFDAAEVYADGL